MFFITSKWAYESTEIIPYKKKDFKLFDQIASKYKPVRSWSCQKRLHFKAFMYPSICYTSFYQLLLSVTVFALFQPLQAPDKHVKKRLKLDNMVRTSPIFHLFFSCNFPCNQSKSALTPVIIGLVSVSTVFLAFIAIFLL